VNDKQVALDACDGAYEDHLKKAASVYLEAFFVAEGQMNADVRRKEAGERFRAGLKVLKAGHDGSRAHVEQVFA